MRATKVWLIFSAGGCGLILFNFQAMWASPAIPKLDENVCWSIEPCNPSQNQIIPFQITVDVKMLNDLNERLTRYLNLNVSETYQPRGFQMGFNRRYLHKVISYWRGSYNWTERVKKLNDLPQFKTTINGLNIYFTHVRPFEPKKKVLPLLLLHGWPITSREFDNLIPYLIKPNDKVNFTFEIIAPTLPGFGYSSAAEKPGLAPSQIALIYKLLMERLGHKRFYVEGGDWGALLARRLAALYPDRIIGVYSTMCLVLSPLARLLTLVSYVHPPLFVSQEFSDKYHIYSHSYWDFLRELGYFIIQSTKPDTLGIALSDTPAGLAAYLLEKISTWTNPSNRNLQNGGLTHKYSMDQLLDVVMMYWTTGSITTSMRLYYENLRSSEQDLALENAHIHVPTACIRFHHEIWQPEIILHTVFKNLVHISDMDEGGHFPAMELPDVLAKDIFTAVTTIENLVN